MKKLMVIVLYLIVVAATRPAGFPFSHDNSDSALWSRCASITRRTLIIGAAQ